MPTAHPLERVRAGRRPGATDFTHSSGVDAVGRR